MSDPLVTVTAYPEREDAQTAQGALDSAGIPSVVDAAVERRVKLRVANVEALRAGDVLNENCATLPEIEEADEEREELRCPACDAGEPAPAHRARMFALIVTMAIAVGVALGVIEAAFFAIATAGVFLLMGGRWRCSACGETWG